MSPAPLFHYLMLNMFRMLIHPNNQKCLLLLMYNTCFSCPILMKLEFFGQIVEKFSCGKLLKNVPVGAELFHADRQT